MTGMMAKRSKHLREEETRFYIFFIRTSNFAFEAETTVDVLFLCFFLNETFETFFPGIEFQNFTVVVFFSR